MRRPSRPPVRPRLVVSAALSVLLVTTAAAVVAAPQAGAATVTTRTSVLGSAASYAADHGYKAGIAVYDTQTGYVMGKNSYSTFASESVVKAMIATRLLLQGRMHGTTASRAYKMITQSDDAIASSLYGSVGGDGLITWIKKHYRISFLGSPPRRAGWWGNTHITAAGMVTFYAKIKKDRAVGPWLINAMHHARTHGSDGFYQFFGLKQATSSAAIKQGWGFDYDDWSRSADMNSTGFVGKGDRYAVAILVRGPARTYGTTMGNAISSIAKRLLPGGTLPDPVPTLTTVSTAHASTAGGQTVTVHGRDFTHVTGVLFGGYRATRVRVLSPYTLQAVTPRRTARTVSVHVATTHGSSTTIRNIVFGPPPVVTGLSTHYGGTAGGATVTVAGRAFTSVVAVWFGAYKASVVKATGSAVQVRAPKHAPGAVDVRVQTKYATSPVAGVAASYRYGVRATVSAPVPTVPTGGGQVTVSGSGFDVATTATLTTPAGVATPTILRRSGTQLVLDMPRAQPGTYSLTIANPAPVGGSTVAVTYADPPPPTQQPTGTPTAAPQPAR